jgi:uncharacterized protein YkwD
MKRAVTWVLTVAAVFAMTGPLAAISAPKLSLRLLKDDTVRITWSGKRGDIEAAAAIQIERVGPGGTSANFWRFDSPGARGNVIDAAPGGETYTYRARLENPDGTTGPWSAPKAIAVPGAPPPPPPPPDPPPAGEIPLPPNMQECAAGINDEVLRLVNIERARSGKPALAADDRLNRAARRHSIDNMTRYLAGQQPNHNGALDYMQDEGYFGSAWAENIAWGGIGSASGVVAGWMNSSGHRANILGNYHDHGISCVRANTRYVWTQNFGR